MFFFKYSNHYRRYRIWYWMYYLFGFPQKQTGCLGASFFGEGTDVFWSGLERLSDLV